MRNLTKVWNMETEPSQGDRALSRGPKFAMLEILQKRVHVYDKYLVVKLWLS